jgi:sugar/nucleoside kinase (ribokinase family)
MAYDLITMGRIGVDLYPLQTGVPLPQVTSFGKFLGGSATNVAVAASRLGRSTAVITRTGEDPFGEYLHQALRDFGVDDRCGCVRRRDAVDVTARRPVGHTTVAGQWRLALLRRGPA